MYFLKVDLPLWTWSCFIPRGNQVKTRLNYITCQLFALFNGIKNFDKVSFALVLFPQGAQIGKATIFISPFCSLGKHFLQISSRLKITPCSGHSDQPLSLPLPDCKCPLRRCIFNCLCQVNFRNAAAAFAFALLIMPHQSLKRLVFVQGNLG